MLERQSSRNKFLKTAFKVSFALILAGTIGSILRQQTTEIEGAPAQTPTPEYMPDETVSLRFPSVNRFQTAPETHAANPEWHKSYKLPPVSYPSGFVNPAYAGYLADGPNLRITTVAQNEKGVVMIGSLFGSKGRQFSDTTTTPLDIPVSEAGSIWRTSASPDGLTITDGKKVYGINNENTETTLIYENADPNGGVAGTPKQVAGETVILTYSQEGQSLSDRTNTIFVTNGKGEKQTLFSSQDGGELILGQPQVAGNVVAAVVRDFNNGEDRGRLLAKEKVVDQWVDKVLIDDSELPIVAVSGSGGDHLVVTHVDFQTNRRQYVIHDIKNNKTYKLPEETYPPTDNSAPIGVHGLPDGRIGIVTNHWVTTSGFYQQEYRLITFSPDNTNIVINYRISPTQQLTDYPFGPGSIAPVGQYPYVPDPYELDLIAPNFINKDYLPIMSS